MKKILIRGAVVIVVGLFLLLNTDSNHQETNLIGDTLFVTKFINAGEGTGNVLLQVPFLSALERSSTLSLAVDIHAAQFGGTAVVN